MNPISAQQAWEVLQQADRLYSPEQVESALADMASRISNTLAGTDPLLVCVMTGGVVPFGRLLTRLQFPLQIDYIHATRYGKQLQGGQLQWLS